MRMSCSESCGYCDQEAATTSGEEQNTSKVIFLNSVLQEKLSTHIN